MVFAPLFVMGSKVKGGLLGKTPELVTDATKDLTYSTDFEASIARPRQMARSRLQQNSR